MVCVGGFLIYKAVIRVSGYQDIRISGHQVEHFSFHYLVPWFPDILHFGLLISWPPDNLIS